MDYSAIPTDPDHPAGTSPWGSSSPNANRQTFPSSDSEVPPSPSLPPPRQQSQYVPEPTDESYVRRQRSMSSEQSEGTTAVDDDDDSTRDLSERLQTAQLGDHDYMAPQQPHLVQQHSQYVAAQRAAAGGPARYHTGARVAPARNVPAYKLQAKITGLERTGKKDPILRFDVHTNLPKFRTTQFRDVRRTHSEFIKLADHLISSNPDAMVPAVPPPLTSAGAGTDEDEARVKGSMQRWLNYVCSNDVLMRDEEMVLFVESDFGYSPVIRMKQPATGVRRKVLKQFAPPPDDTPELHEARPVVKLFYLGTMDAGQKLDRVVKARRGLGLAESELGVKIGQMHVQETHVGLSNAYRKLGRVIQTVGDYHAAQGTAEATTLSDPLNYHSSDAFIVKETLTNRHILLRELLQAQQATRSKRSAADRLRSSTSVRREKVDEAIAALDEAISHENYLTQKCHRVTANLLIEKRRWFQRTASDFLLSIRDYTIRQIEAERRTLSTLETIRPDIRTIDSSGGLSRLGRETHPAAAARRASLAASQGPKGDAWSGVPRRQDQLNRSISGGFGVSSVSTVSEEGTEGGPAGGGSGGSGSGGGGSLNGAGNDGRPRAVSGTGSLRGVKEEEDEDRVDAKNAASRLATSTF